MKKLHRAKRTLYVFAGTHREMLAFMAERGLRSNEIVLAISDKAYSMVATSLEPIVLVQSAGWPVHESMIPGWEQLCDRALVQNRIHGHPTEEIQL